MSNKRKLLVILSAIIILVVIVLLATRSLLSQAYGNVTIDFNLTDFQNIDAKVNGKKLTISGLRKTYRFPIGNDNLIVTKPNYQQFETNFTLENHQTLIINIVMQTTAPQNQSIANNQLETGLNGYLPAGFSLVQVTYFYNSTWAVATVSTPSNDQAIIVAKYVGGNSLWRIVLGPGTLFNTSNLSNLPVNVAAFMNQQNYVIDETPTQ